jgi:hypothetical protein
VLSLLGLAIRIPCIKRVTMLRDIAPLYTIVSLSLSTHLSFSSLNLS